MADKTTTRCPKPGRSTSFGEPARRGLQRAYLKGSDTEVFDEFGGAVALTRDGSLLAVGARYEDSAATGINGYQTDNSEEGAGAVYVFTVTATR
jgi:hypothetical protein